MENYNDPHLEANDNPNVKNNFKIPIIIISFIAGLGIGFIFYEIYF